MIIKSKVNVMGNNRIGKIAASPEGVAALRELAQNLKVNNENIRSACDSLQQTVTALGEKLGTFENDINDEISKIKAALNNSNGAIEELAVKTEELAEKLEDFIRPLNN